MYSTKITETIDFVRGSFANTWAYSTKFLATVIQLRCFAEPFADKQGSKVFERLS